MKKTLAFFFGLMCAAPSFAASLKEELSAESPCLMAFESSQLPRGVVFCMVARRKGAGEQCLMTGYRVAKQVFTQIRTGDLSVDVSCYRGGLERLLELSYAGVPKLKTYLNQNSKLIYVGAPEWEDLILDQPVAVRVRPRPAHDAPGAGMVESVPNLNEEIPRRTVMGPDPGMDVNTVEVYFATDRDDTMDRNDPEGRFTNERSPGGQMAYGFAHVTIPPGHKKGVIEAPSIWSFEFSLDPRKHIHLKHVVRRDADNFFNLVRTRVGSSQKKEAFVFIHGFNVTFKDAIIRTAQMAYDLNFDGAPITYTWPSGEKLWQYSIAEGNAEWTYRHLQQFLEDVAAKSGAERVHLIAHSMGNRPLSEALNALAPRKLFRHIVLAAPDIDTEVFQQMEQQIRGTAERVTIYASENDAALKVSRKMHDYPRLGQGGRDLFVTSIADTVETSKVDVSALGHSYYGDSIEVLSDLALLLFGDKAAESRPLLTRQQRGAKQFWLMTRPARVN